MQWFIEGGKSCDSERKHPDYAPIVLATTIAGVEQSVLEVRRLSVGYTASGRLHWEMTEF
jgi:hypothetical protein